MMWRSIRAGGEEPGFAYQFSRHRMDLGCFEGFVQRKWRKDGRKSFCQHRFSGARWPDHDYVMSAGCSNLKGPFYILLSLYISKIRIITVHLRCEHCFRVDLKRFDLNSAGEKSHGFGKIGNGKY